MFGGLNWFNEYCSTKQLTMKTCINCGVKNSDPNAKFCTRKCKNLYNSKMGKHGMKGKRQPLHAADFFGVCFDYEGNHI